MANVRGIIQSMITYAQGNNSAFPVLWAIPGNNAYMNTSWDDGVSNQGMTAPEVVQDWYRNNMAQFPGDAAYPMFSEWVLVLQGYETPASFICPSDPIAVGPSPEYSVSNGVTSYMSNFQAPGSALVTGGVGNGINVQGQGLSYSIAWPWNWEGSVSAGGIGPVGEWWTTTHANTLTPLVSDMAPIDDNTGDTTGIYLRLTTTLPTANTYGPYIYNSGNHAGDGQNVGFGDDHVTWETSPYVGENGDNIFTYTTATGVVNGTTDTNQVGVTGPNGLVGDPKILTYSAPYDTCMVPVRTVNPAVAASSANPGGNWAW